MARNPSESVTQSSPVFNPGIIPLWFGCAGFPEGQSKQVDQFCKAFSRYCSNIEAYNESLKNKADDITTSIKKRNLLHASSAMTQCAVNNSEVPAYTAYSVIQETKFSARKYLTTCQYDAFCERGLFDNLFSKANWEIVLGKASKPLNDFSRLPHHERDTCNVALATLSEIQQAEDVLDERMRKSIQPTSKIKKFTGDTDMSSICNKIIQPHPTKENGHLLDPSSWCLLFACVLLRRADQHYAAALSIINLSKFTAVDHMRHMLSSLVTVSSPIDVSKVTAVDHMLRMFSSLATASKIIAACPDVPEQAAEQALDSMKKFSHAHMERIEDLMQTGNFYEYTLLDAGVIGPVTGVSSIVEAILHGKLPSIPNLMNANDPRDIIAPDPAVIQGLKYHSQQFYHGLRLFKATVDKADETFRKRQFTV